MKIIKFSFDTFEKVAKCNQNDVLRHKFGVIPQYKCSEWLWEEYKFKRSIEPNLYECHNECLLTSFLLTYSDYLYIELTEQ